MAAARPAYRVPTCFDNRGMHGRELSMSAEHQSPSCYSRRAFGQLMLAALPFSVTADQGPRKRIDIEYEYPGADPVSEVRKCYEFCRSALSA
jgi:hypothetical protein